MIMGKKIILLAVPTVTTTVSHAGSADTYRFISEMFCKSDAPKLMIERETIIQKISGIASNKTLAKDEKKRQILAVKKEINVNKDKILSVVTAWTSKKPKMLDAIHQINGANDEQLAEVCRLASLSCSKTVPDKAKFAVACADFTLIAAKP